MRRIFAPAVLWLLLNPIFSNCAAELTVHLANPTSAEAMLPARLDLPKGSATAYHAGVCPVDVVTEGGKTYLSIGRYPRPMTVEKIVLREGQASTPVLMKVIERPAKPKTFLIQTRDVSWELGAQGIVSFSRRGNLFAFKPQHPAEADLKKTFHGGTLIRFTLASATDTTTYTFYQTGLVEIRTERGLVFDLEADKLTTYQWGTYGTVTYHLETVPSPYEPNADPAGQASLQSPMDWAVNVRDEGTGLWIARQGSGDIGLVNPRLGEWQKEWKSGPQPRTRTHYWCTFNLGKKTVALLGPVHGAADGKRLYAGTRPMPVFLQQDGLFVAQGDFNGDGRDEKIAVEDRNRDSQPDLVQDRWSFYSAATAGASAVYSFGPRSEDPVGEGRFFYLSLDLNGDGRIDAEELERPTFKFVDWNQNGIFFTGSLLEGGAIDQDCFYYSAKGSSGHVNWEEKYMAYDLDGDGDHDIFFSAEGQERGWITSEGTAESTTALMIDYGDRDYSYVLRLDLFQGKHDIITSATITAFSSRPNHIFYDYYFFSGNACATACPTREDGFLIPNEEHMEYEGFAPYGQAHLWTMVQHLGRVIWGELGGSGGWKLGVEPQDTDAFIKPRWKSLTYTDPWGHQIKIKSYLMPAKWDGQALNFRRVEGQHLDYIDRGLWPWIMTFNGASRAAIEEEGHGGEWAFEAYVQALGAWGRTELTPTGTTFYFYYSPLVGGLHHRGMTEGWCTGVNFRYYDTDRDGITDTYLYDADNDNAFEKRCWYDHAAGRVQLLDGNKLSLWFRKYDFPGHKMYLENFLKIDALYRRGYGEDPLLLRARIDDAGRLTLKGEPTPLCLTFTEQWLPVAAWDVVHAGLEEKGKADFKMPKEVSTTLATKPLVLTRLNEPFSESSLARVDLLFVSRLDDMLTGAESDSLRQWVNAGGTLVLAVAARDEAGLIAYNAIAKGFGLEVEPTCLDYGGVLFCIPDYGNSVGDTNQVVLPVRANRAAQFVDRAQAGLLADRDYILYTGYPLKLHTADARPLLSHLDRVLIAEARYGKGLVYLLGADELLSLPGLPGLVAAGLAYVSVPKAQLQGKTYDLQLQGKGGDILVGSPGPAIKVTADGVEKLLPAAAPPARFSLPGGKKVQVTIEEL